MMPLRWCTSEQEGFPLLTLLLQHCLYYPGNTLDPLAYFLIIDASISEKEPWSLRLLLAISRECLNIYSLLGNELRNQAIIQILRKPADQMHSCFMFFKAYQRSCSSLMLKMVSGRSNRTLVWPRNR